MTWKKAVMLVVAVVILGAIAINARMGITSPISIWYYDICCDIRDAQIEDELVFWIMEEREPNAIDRLYFLARRALGKPYPQYCIEKLTRKVEELERRRDREERRLKEKKFLQSGRW